MLTSEEWEQKFWKFLGRKGLIRKFKKNVNLDIERVGKDNKFSRSLKSDMVNAVNYGFVWEKTDEKHPFWEEVHREWEHCIRKTSINIGGYSVQFNSKSMCISVGCYNIPWETVKRIHSEILKLEE